MRYYALKSRIAVDDLNRVVSTLERLRTQLDESIPAKDSQENLLLATWNIRDFDKPNRAGDKGHGARLPETFFYLAEIISRFDIVAVQEVNGMKEWEDLMYILGPEWDYIATGATDAKLGGNGERLTFAYDRRKVSFKKILDEIVLPPDLEVGANKAAGTRGKQFNRTPVKAAFQSGWLKFDLCTVHIYYGAESGAALKQRRGEIERIADYLAKEAKNAKKDGRATFLLGDFNIVHPEHETMQALLASGFKVPASLSSPSNIGGTKFYDQIAFMEGKGLLEYAEITGDSPLERNAGVFDIFQELMRPEDFKAYRPHLMKSSGAKGKKAEKIGLEGYYKEWRTYQISDHKPMWVRLQTNDSNAYLENLKNETTEP